MSSDLRRIAVATKRMLKHRSTVAVFVAGMLVSLYVIDLETGHEISLSLFAPANTLASLLASNFPEAGQLEVEALMYAAMVLLVITFVVNVAGLAIQQYTMRKFEGKK